MMENIKNNKLFYIVTTLVIVFIFIVYAILNYYNSTTEVTIRYKNVNNVSVGEYHGEHGEIENDDQKKIYIKKSGEKVRLNNTVSYSVNYSGDKGFADGFQVFKPADKSSININPYYSNEKLETLLTADESSIQQVLIDKYPNIKLYEIQKGKLYHWGEWYATTLLYIGNDYDNSDTLRVVLKKENSKWVIKTDPPQIILSKTRFTDIPSDILSDINNKQVKMLDKFTNPDTSHGPGGQ